jgi:hypothetical protein
VTAEANPVVSEGAITSTGTPIGGKQSLWVNGIEIEVDFVQNESGTDRRAKVVAAINERTGQHGVTATDNGKGVTMSTDGRNLSVWYDSSKDELSAASFGLDKGGAVAQISKIKVAGAGVAAGELASVYINGVKVETAALVATSTAAETSAALVLAINSNTSLKNVTAKLDPDDVTNTSILITSNVAGNAFDLRAPAVTGASTQTMTLSTVAPNSQGATDVSAVDMSSAYLTKVLGSATAPVIKIYFASVII